MRPFRAFFRGAAVLAAALALPISPAADAPAQDQGATLLLPFEAEYRVRMKGLGGTMTLRLARSDSGYLATSRLKPRGLASMLAGGEVEETTEFDIVDHRVRPLRYTLRDTIGRNDDTGRLTFDWDQAVATGKDNEQDLEYSIDAMTVDRASLQYALMMDLARGRSAAAYTMLDGDRRKPLVIEQAGERSVDVPLGTYSVREVRHQTRGSSRRAVLYLADELGFLPVRIEQYKDDKLRVRAELVSYTSQPD